MPEEEYLTSKEAADLIGVSERTMYYYLRDRAKTGFPEPKRFSRSLMWPRQAITEWRARHPARPRRKPAHDDSAAST